METGMDPPSPSTPPVLSQRTMSTATSTLRLTTSVTPITTIPSSRSTSTTVTTATEPLPPSCSVRKAAAATLSSTARSMRSTATSIASTSSSRSTCSTTTLTLSPTQPTTRSTARLTTTLSSHSRTDAETLFSGRLPRRTSSQPPQHPSIRSSQSTRRSVTPTPTRSSWSSLTASRTASRYESKHASISASRSEVIAKPTEIQAVSKTNMALNCPEILYAIGEQIPVFKRLPGIADVYNFIPRTILNCCLVSKYWRKVLTPLLWRVDETQSMWMVPYAVLEKNREHVRTYIGNRGYFKDHQEPPMYKQLRELCIGNAVKLCGVAMRLIGSNTRLKKLEMNQIPLFDQLKQPQGNGNHNHNESDNDNSHSLTNPLGHLRTLQELHLSAMHFKGSEFYWVLRTVARRRLQTLRLNCVSGTLDLQDLIFVSLTRLHLWLDDRMRPGAHDIIGRSPCLEHLELSGTTPYPLDSLNCVLSGTQPQETLIQREQRLQANGLETRQWSRPQLAVLTLNGLHLRTRQGNTMDEGNDPKFLQLVRACSGIDSKSKKEGNLGSLRELDLTLWVLDDHAREAIEMHSSSLEVLKIRILRGRESIPERKMEQQGLVLRKILLSCSRIRELEFWDQNGDEDMSVVMGQMIRYHGVHSGPSDSDSEAWSCPQLESLTLKSSRIFQTLNNTRFERARQYLDDDETNGSVNGNGVVPWTRRNLTCDAALKDGTSILLDVHWHGFELFVDPVEDATQFDVGEQLLKTFLRHISPSKKLSELQLGQLLFTRTVVPTGAK